ncbi:unnamed protein product [Choristocarpus tenellus]
MSFLENNLDQEMGQDGVSEDAGEGRKSVVEARGVTFLYKVVPGQARRSYGLNAAREAGMDEEMLSMAALKSKEMRERGITLRGESRRGEAGCIGVISSASIFDCCIIHGL